MIWETEKVRMIKRDTCCCFFIIIGKISKENLFNESQHLRNIPCRGSRKNFGKRRRQPMGGHIQCHPCSCHTES